MTSPTRQTAVILSEYEDGTLSIDLRLSHRPDIQGMEVPSIDILTMALANIAVRAEPEFDAAIARIHEAYEDLKNSADPNDGVEAFNDAVGVQIYNVAATLENNAS